MKFFNHWVEKGYIIYAKEVKPDGSVVETNIPNLTSKGEDAHGFFGLFELLLERYSLTWKATAKIVAFAITTLVALAGTGIATYYFTNVIRHSVFHLPYL